MHCGGCTNTQSHMVQAQGAQSTKHMVASVQKPIRKAGKQQAYDTGTSYEAQAESIAGFLAS
jgi:hypothetical protein